MDNVKNKTVVKEQRMESKRRFRPSILLPIMRVPTFISQKTISKPKDDKNQRSQSKKEESMKKIIKRLDLKKSLIQKEDRIRKSNALDTEAYKRFNKTFYEFDTQYHFRLKQKYESEMVKKNRTMNWCNYRLDIH